MNKNDVIQLANQLMFNLTDEQAEDIVNEFDVLGKQLALLEAVDTTGVEEMIYPFEDETSYLREDELVNVITQEAALENAPRALDGHFEVPKVVK